MFDDCFMCCVGKKQSIPAVKVFMVRVQNTLGWRIPVVGALGGNVYFAYRPGTLCEKRHNAAVVMVMNILLH